MNMHMKVVNECLAVGNVYIIGVASSSVFLIGDTQEVNCSSIFDTPPEAVTEIEVPLAGQR